MEIERQTLLVKGWILALVLVIEMSGFNHFTNIVSPHLPENLLVYHIFANFFYVTCILGRGRILRSWWELILKWNIAAIIRPVVILTVWQRFLIIWDLISFLELLLLLVWKKISIFLLNFWVLLFLELLEWWSKLLDLTIFFVLCILHNKLITLWFLVLS